MVTLRLKKHKKSLDAATTAIVDRFFKILLKSVDY